MKRKSGEYVTQAATGESYPAYLPAHLSPDPPLALDTGLLQHMDRANRTLGRLDGIEAIEKRLWSAADTACARAVDGFTLPTMASATLNGPKPVPTHY